MNTKQTTTTGSDSTVQRTFQSTIHALATERRLWQVFGLGIASGFGFLIHRTPVTLWLVAEGRSRTSIGLFGAVLLPYAFNYLWAPLVDHLRIPYLARFGQLRSWLLLSLVVMFGCTLAVSFLDIPTHVSVKVPEIDSSTTVRVSAMHVQKGDYVETDEVLFVVQSEYATALVNAPSSGQVIDISAPTGSEVEQDDTVVVLRETESSNENGNGTEGTNADGHWWPEFSPLFLLAFFMVILAFASATLDIANAGYRITIIQANEPHLVGLAASMEISGWWAGFTLPAVVIVGTDLFGWSWPTVFKWLALFFLLLIAFVLFLLKEPQRPSHPSSRFSGTLKVVDELLVKRLFGPVIEFFQRNGVALAFCLLFFLVSFKLGEAFLGSMSATFYKEVGFENTEFWIMSKFGSALIIVPSTILAGMFIGKFKLVPTLVVAGISMAATNLMLAWIALVGDSTILYFWTIVLDGITTAFSTVAFVTFITMYTARLHATTQYTAMSSIATSGRTVLAMLSGLLIDALGGNWTVFFILTALWIIPVLGILKLLTNLVDQRENEGVKVKTYEE